MKKYSSIYWILGLCAFLAVICTGFNWMITKFNWDIPLLRTIVYYADLVLKFSAYILGLFWCLAIKNKTARIVFLVFYVAFVILSVMGVFHIAL